MRAKLAREWGVPGWLRMRYAYAETTPVLNLAAPSQIRGGWPEVGTTAAESTRLTHPPAHPPTLCAFRLIRDESSVVSE